MQVTVSGHTKPSQPLIEQVERSIGADGEVISSAIHPLHGQLFMQAGCIVVFPVASETCENLTSVVR